MGGLGSLLGLPQAHCPRDPSHQFLRSCRLWEQFLFQLCRLWLEGGGLRERMKIELHMFIFPI